MASSPWALEHGVSFFLTCWYREAGNEGQAVKPALDHWLAAGLPRSRFGGEDAAREAIDAMRAACREAGFAGLCVLGQSCWGEPETLARRAERIRRSGMVLLDNWNEFGEGHS